MKKDADGNKILNCGAAVAELLDEVIKSQIANRLAIIQQNEYLTQEEKVHLTSAVKEAQNAWIAYHDATIEASSTRIRGWTYSVMSFETAVALDRTAASLRLKEARARMLLSEKV
jgi:uncharacterized protein YecT (DUF1311 family)